MEEKKVLQFDTGVVTYSVNDKYDLVINPTDIEFIERLYDTFYVLDEKQEEYKAEIAKAQKREVFDIARKRDLEMRDMIDSVLGEGASEQIFGKMNVYALADGLPVWANLLLTILDETDDVMSKAENRGNDRLKKYTDKYNKRKAIR